MNNLKSRLDARSRKIAVEKDAPELAKKLQRISELAKVISLGAGQSLTREQKQETDNEQFKLEFHLKELQKEFREREADFKIAAMERIINLLK